MSPKLRLGWKLTKSHSKLIVLLFIYQAVWGFVLYRIIDQLVSPLLLRYPKITNSNEALQLFWIENEFQLTKTNVIIPYLLGLAGLLLLRMLITPLLQSGIHYSLYTMSQGEKRTSFREGIKKCWKPMMLVYWIKSLAMIAPLIWLLKPLFKLNGGASPLAAMTEQSSWLWLAYLLWVIIVSMIFYIIQLGIGAQLSPLEALMKGLKHIVIVFMLAIVLMLLYGFISLSIHTLSVMWVTFFSFLLYQLLPLIRSVFKVWTIASQYSAIGNDLQQST